MSYEPSKQIYPALTQIAEFINENKQVFTETHLQEMREMWKAAWNCRDAPTLKKLVISLNRTRFQTGKKAEIAKGWVNSKYSYTIQFS